jgi:hypothetical protein
MPTPTHYPRLGDCDYLDGVPMEVPEHKLLIAILERAALDYAGPAKVQQHIRRSAKRFFRSERTDEWSFDWICRHLTVDHEWFKAQILSGLEKALRARDCGRHLSMCVVVDD